MVDNKVLPHTEPSKGDTVTIVDLAEELLDLVWPRILFDLAEDTKYRIEGLRGLRLGEDKDTKEGRRIARELKKQEDQVKRLLSEEVQGSVRNVIRDRLVDKLEINELFILIDNEIAIQKLATVTEDLSDLFMEANQK